MKECRRGGCALALACVTLMACGETLETDVGDAFVTRGQMLSAPSTILMQQNMNDAFPRYVFHHPGCADPNGELIVTPGAEPGSLDVRYTGTESFARPISVWIKQRTFESDPTHPLNRILFHGRLDDNYGTVRAHTYVNMHEGTTYELYISQQCGKDPQNKDLISGFKGPYIARTSGQRKTLKCAPPEARPERAGNQLWLTRASSNTGIEYPTGYVSQMGHRGRFHDVLKPDYEVRVRRPGDTTWVTAQIDYDTDHYNNESYHWGGRATFWPPSIHPDSDVEWQARTLCSSEAGMAHSDWTSLQFSAGADPCGDSVCDGDEDFITCPADCFIRDRCPGPTNHQTTSITDTEATLTWDLHPDVQYVTVSNYIGSDLQTVRTVSASAPQSHQLTDLTPDTRYNWVVRTFCDPRQYEQPSFTGDQVHVEYFQTEEQAGGVAPPSGPGPVRTPVEPEEDDPLSPTLF